MGLISDNGISKVWREGNWVYKQQPQHLTQNEIWCLEQLYPFRCVPYAEQVNEETIKTAHLPQHIITSPIQVRAKADEALFALGETGIRHGDLTEKNIIIYNDTVFLIDFAESRLACDPRPDKRPEGDEYWLTRTIQEMIDGRT